MKRQILSIIIALACMAAGAAKLDFENRDAATVGILVVDLATGKEVCSENPDRAMIPASILKTLTSASALAINGPQFRYETDVEIAGRIEGTTLRGNLVVKASGDPTIESAAFDDHPSFMQSIVDAVSRLGITHIAGDIIVDEPSPLDFGPNPQWTVGDVGWSYGAANYGFNYSDNTFLLNTYTLETTPDMPAVDLNVERTPTGLDVVHGIYSDTYYITGRDVEKPRNQVSLPMDSPSEAFIYNLKDRLALAGISVAGTVADTDGSVARLVTHYSPANIEILRSMMFRSDNMMAEATLRSIAPGQSRGACIKKEKAYWEERGVNPQFTQIFDGSGLARAERVTPRFLADLLTTMARGEQCDQYVSLFPKVGKEGTVKNLFKKSQMTGRLALKSGSVNAVQCYAGYRLNDAGEPTHAIVIMVNSFFCSRADLRKAIEKFIMQTL